MTTVYEGKEFKGQFPHDGDSHPVAVVAGLVTDTRTPGLTNSYNLVSVSSDGKLEVSTVGTIFESTRTGSEAIAFTTGLTNDFRLDHVRVHFTTATSNGLTITVNDVDGSRYDTILNAVMLNMDTDYVWIPNSTLMFKRGSEITLDYVNSGSALYGAKIVTEIL